MRLLRRASRTGATAAIIIAGLSRSSAIAEVPCGGYDVEIVAFDCGYPIGPSGSFGYGLAPNGTVVGSFWDCQLSFFHAFLWPPGGSMQVVPYPPGVVTMEMADVNDTDQAVGTYQATGNGLLGSVGFLLRSGRFASLGVLPGADTSHALAINASGVIAGWSGTIFMGTTPRSAVLWEQDGTIINLAPDLGTPESEAADVTDSGLVTGWMGTFFVDNIPFIWDAGNVVELPLLPEPEAYATMGQAINDLGNVCGWGLVSMPGIDYGQAYAFIDGRPISLGRLPGYQGSVANDINNLNQIVGRCQGDAPFAAFVWNAGVMHDLSSTIDPALNLRISNATAITDSGIITGEATAVPSGDSFAVRLRPRPSIGADLDCDGSIASADLQILIAHWGTCASKGSCPADLNSDGMVNGYDLGILLGSWS